MNLMQPSWVYILKCNDDTYYTGITTNIDRRLRQHANHSFGLRSYTATRTPVTLLYTEEYSNYVDARRRERVIKAFSHEKKEALIATNPIL